MRRLVLGTPLLALIVFLGCDAARSRVHGTVSHQGKPLAGAVVTFFGPDNSTFTADTGADGRYEIVGIRRGAMRVSVQIPPPPQKPRPDPAGAKGGSSVARAEDTAKAGRLPSLPTASATPPPVAGAVALKYADPKTSELSVEIKEQDQAYNIDLK